MPERELPSASPCRFAARVVMNAAEVRYPDNSSVGDDTLAECYANVLRWDPHAPNDAVRVKVEKSCVTLTGNVPFYHTSRRSDSRCGGSSASPTSST